MFSAEEAVFSAEEAIFLAEEAVFSATALLAFASEENTPHSSSKS